MAKKEQAPDRLFIPSANRREVWLKRNSPRDVEYVRADSLWHNPHEEVPYDNRQVIIMVTIYDWYCARYDAETETWRAGRHGDIVFSRGYVHLWLDMQEEFKVRIKED